MSGRARTRTRMCVRACVRTCARALSRALSRARARARVCLLRQISSAIRACQIAVRALTSGRVFRLQLQLGVEAYMSVEVGRVLFGGLSLGSGVYRNVHNAQSPTPSQIYLQVGKHYKIQHISAEQPSLYYTTTYHHLLPLDTSYGSPPDVANPQFRRGAQMCIRQSCNQAVSSTTSSIGWLVLTNRYACCA